MYTVETIWNVISWKVEHFHIVCAVVLCVCCVHKNEAVCSFITVYILMPEIISGRISAHCHPFSRLSNTTGNERCLFHRQPRRSSGAAADYGERERVDELITPLGGVGRRERKKGRGEETTHPEDSGFQEARTCSSILWPSVLPQAPSWTLRNWTPTPTPPLPPSHPPIQLPEAANWENGEGMGWCGGGKQPTLFCVSLFLSLSPLHSTMSGNAVRT